jgi:hypothetical protein
MVMVWQDAALALAGIVGCAVAVVHGVLVQRLMVRPIEGLAGGPLSGPVHRLVPALLQFSTFNWFLGGLALIAVAAWSGPAVKLATGLLVGSSYLFAAVGNFWGTRGRHPGWMLMAAALILIVVGVSPSGP